MAYKYFNPNPYRRTVDDCVVRAICKIFKMDWLSAYLEVCIHGGLMGNMPSANEVWGDYLRSCGFTRVSLPSYCPDCYTIAQFADEHPIGVFIVATGSHVVAVIDGVYYDTNDSGDEVVAYYWRGEY